MSPVKTYSTMDLNSIKDLASQEKIADIKEKVCDIAETVEEKARVLGEKIDNDKVREFAEKVKGNASKVKNALENYPGAAIDSSDGDKVSPKMVAEDVTQLNNNPRNNDI